MQQNKHDLLKCPEYGCENLPTSEEIEAIINGNVFKKYQEFQINTKVAADKNLLFCTTPDCGEVLNV